MNKGLSNHFYHELIVLMGGNGVVKTSVDIENLLRAVGIDTRGMTEVCARSPGGISVIFCDGREVDIEDLAGGLSKI